MTTHSRPLTHPSFLFPSYGHHRDLHSFPTRRSSDLTVSPRRRFRLARRAPATRTRGSPIRAETVRSEEHTSELQSLRHLVCRLLLEKKKTTENCPGDCFRTRAMSYRTPRLSQSIRET